MKLKPTIQSSTLDKLTETLYRRSRTGRRSLAIAKDMKQTEQFRRLLKYSKRKWNTGVGDVWIRLGGYHILEFEFALTKFRKMRKKDMPENIKHVMSRSLSILRNTIGNDKIFKFEKNRIKVKPGSIEVKLFKAAYEIVYYACQELFDKRVIVSDNYTELIKRLKRAKKAAER